MNDVLVPLLPLIIIGIIFAIPNYFLAKKLKKNGVLWAILALVPIVNYFFLIYAMYVTLFYIIDKLNEISDRQTAR